MMNDLVLPPGQVSAVVLGTMQDGGLPHAGCCCSRCTAAFTDPCRAAYAASLALVDGRLQPPAVWLIDASPDIKYQLNLLVDVLGPHSARPGRLRQPTGIFLTHAHMGHMGGLPQLGPEAMAVERLPVYASEGVIDLLRTEELWRPLVENLHLVPLTANVSRALAPDLTITPIPLPHRDEWNVGTFAFRIQGPAQSLLYLPDIDAWEQWPAVREVLATVDTALVDGTFYSRDELGGRKPVAHPLIPDTLHFFTGLPTRLIFTHINHTNPVLDDDSHERQQIVAAGAEIAYSGQILSL